MSMWSTPSAIFRSAASLRTTEQTKCKQELVLASYPTSVLPWFKLAGCIQLKVAHTAFYCVSAEVCGLSQPIKTNLPTIYPNALTTPTIPQPSQPPWPFSLSQPFPIKITQLALQPYMLYCLLHQTPLTQPILRVAFNAVCPNPSPI